MEWQQLDQITKVLSFAFSICVGVYAWWAARRADVDKHFQKTDARVAELDGRLRDIESEVESLPGKDDLHQIQLQLAHQTGAINEVKAVVRGSNEIMQRLENIVSRHEDHLLGGR